jgi:hypothetical protein
MAGGADTSRNMRQLKYAQIGNDASHMTFTPKKGLPAMRVTPSASVSGMMSRVWKCSKRCTPKG